MRGKGGRERRGRGVNGKERCEGVLMGGKGRGCSEGRERGKWG